MAARRERAADNRCGECGRRRRIAEHAGRKRRARRNADERVDRVPQRVHTGHLVDKEFDAEHESGSGEHPRMRERRETPGKLDHVEIAETADDEEHRVQPDPACPAKRRCQRDQLPGVELREGGERAHSRPPYVLMFIGSSSCRPPQSLGDARCAPWLRPPSLIRAAVPTPPAVCRETPPRLPSLQEWRARVRCAPRYPQSRDHRWGDGRLIG